MIQFDPDAAISRYAEMDDAPLIKIGFHSPNLTPHAAELARQELVRRGVVYQPKIVSTLKPASDVEAELRRRIAASKLTSVGSKESRSELRSINAARFLMAAFIYISVVFLQIVFASSMVSSKDFDTLMLLSMGLAFVPIFLVLAVVNLVAIAFSMIFWKFSSSWVDHEHGSKPN